jgi:hypothetical protein
VGTFVGSLVALAVAVLLGVGVSAALVGTRIGVVSEAALAGSALGADTARSYQDAGITPGLP